MLRIAGAYQQVSFLRANRGDVVLREEPRRKEYADSSGETGLDESAAADVVS